MKKFTLVPLAAISLCPQLVIADLWVSNFETAGGGIAGGVWRNNTTSTDTTIPIELLQAGAVFDEETDLSGSTDWADLFGFNLFEPNYIGDFVSLEVLGGDTAFVTISFNAEIVNPVLNFTDVDLQTVIMFNQTPTQVAGAPNLSVVGNNVFPNGSPLPLISPPDFETLGSIQFTGTYTALTFSIVNSGSDPFADDDRTGFSVSTTTEPVPIIDLTGKLDISYTGGLIHLSWPDLNTFSRIDCFDSNNPNVWMPVLSLDPTTQTSGTLPLNTTASGVYFRGIGQ